MVPANLSDSMVVITVCDAAFEELGRDRVQTHWSIPDPVSIGTDRAFDQVIEELRDRISHLKGNPQ
jgi:protein-tyrosine-phosphatase